MIINSHVFKNTWPLIIILLLLALVLGKRVFKKIYSWLKATHPGDVEETRLEDICDVIAGAWGKKF